MSIAQRILSSRRSASRLIAIGFFLSSPFPDSDRTYLKDLAEADRLAWLTDWYAALPFYERAEKAATHVGDRRNTLHAKFGRLRGEMQRHPLPDLSEALAKALETEVVKNDAQLRLRALTVKGDIDLEWDVSAAEIDWLAVRALAEELGETGWENRAKGELGMIAFLQGNTAEAATLVERALQTAIKDRDVGGQLRYLAAIANGLLSAGYPHPALMYADKALAFSRQHPETGFPYAAYSTKVLTHLRLNQVAEADRFARAAINEARTGDRRIKEIELLLMLAAIARHRGEHDKALDHQESAVRIARAGTVRRLLADAEQDLAEGYRARGDLGRAETHARAAVIETEAAGSRFNLPGRLEVLASVYAAKGNTADADRTYQRATDVVEGILANVPTSVAQARLIGVMSSIYLGHFTLAADRMRAPSRAYDIIERARGRALADVLRSRGSGTPSSQDAIKQNRTISQLQLQLMKARNAGARRRLLERIEMAERGTFVTDRLAGLRLSSPSPANVRLVQRTLAPDEILIEYVLAEPRSYGIVITDRTLALKPLPSEKTINDLVDLYIAAVRSSAVDLVNADRLHGALLKPLALTSATPKIVIVPDGRLNLLPFDQLFDPDSNTQVVSIAPSATVFALLRTSKSAPARTRPLLAIGDVPYGPAVPTIAAKRGSERIGLYDITAPPQLAQLVTARSELEAAANAMGPNSVVLAGDRATESQFKAQPLVDFRALHFAVHGVADSKYPERAALVLLGDPAAGEDGLLQPREISRLSLTASVVVLSACETAAGPTIGQEGVLNLARAFLLAGARSVVTTLWTVGDDTSTALMKRLYAHLAAGHDVAHSLTAAKRDVLKRFGPDALSTVAAFQVVGAGDATLNDMAPRNATRSAQ